MNTTQVKQELHQFIETNDEKFLRIFHAMAKEYTKKEKIVYYQNGKPITKKQLYADLKEAEQEIENGDYYTIEELKKESETWD